MPREKNGQLAFFPIKPTGRPADKSGMSSQKPAATNPEDAMRDFTPTTSITFDADGHLVVRTFFSKAGVDRTEAMAFGLGEPNERRHALALRLVRAIEAGRVFTGCEISTDCNGATYVGCACQVIGRRMSADLKRLGF